MARARSVALACAALLAATGCSTDSALVDRSDPATTSEPSGGDFLDMYLVRADDLGVSDGQRDVLERARDAGEVTPSLAREGLDAFFSCLDDHGVSHEFAGTDGTQEFPRFEYSVGEGASGDVCYQAEFALIDEAYQTQPRATAASEARLLEHRPELVSCIREAGGSIDDEATPVELKRELWFVFMGYYSDDPDAVIDPSFEGVDCLGQVGLPVSDL